MSDPNYDLCFSGHTWTLDDRYGLWRRHRCSPRVRWRQRWRYCNHRWYANLVLPQHKKWLKPYAYCIATFPSLMRSKCFTEHFEITLLIFEHCSVSSGCRIGLVLFLPCEPGPFGRGCRGVLRSSVDYRATQGSLHKDAGSHINHFPSTMLINCYIF